MITVVSGLPRSGTSMMMSMLKAGGVSVLTDDQREADEDNLRGYLEYEQVKQLDQEQRERAMAALAARRELEERTGEGTIAPETAATPRPSIRDQGVYLRMPSLPIRTR